MRDEASAPAYEREIEDCRTLIGYFERLTGAPSSAGLAEPKLSDPDGALGSKLPQLGEARQVDGDPFKGMTAVKKKGDDDDAGGFFMGGGGGGKKGKSAKRPDAKSAAGGGAAAQSLQLPLATLTALLALGVPTPMTREEIPGTVASLSEKRKYFTENQVRRHPFCRAHALTHPCRHRRTGSQRTG